jgi:hypothetical protein
MWSKTETRPVGIQTKQRIFSAKFALNLPFWHLSIPNTDLVKILPTLKLTRIKAIKCSGTAPRVPIILRFCRNAQLSEGLQERFINEVVQTVRVSSISLSSFPQQPSRHALALVAPQERVVIALTVGPAGFGALQIGRRDGSAAVATFGG